MKKNNYFKVSLVFAIIFIATSCSKNADKNFTQTNSNPKTVTEEMMSESGANPDEQSISVESAAAANNTESAVGNSNGHYLYTESNEAGNNRILVYKIKYNGSLNYEGATASGGMGTGAILGSSQGALVLDKEHEWLYAVNAGSNSVSSFKVNNDGSVTLADTENSGGMQPFSVSVSGNLLYVLNHGSDNIQGFRITGNGKLHPIQNSNQPLSSKAVDAPEISFTPNGDFIIVTEKTTNVIGTFKVKNNGSINAGLFTTSVGATPFGFAFSRNQFMIVSNAEGGTANAGSATSYTIESNGKLNDINGAIKDFGTAPCWFAVTKYGRFAYTTNTATNNISSYYVAPWGGIYLVQKEAATTDTQPLDIVVATNNYFVYELNGTAHSIGGYHRTFFGGLQFMGSTPNLPTGSSGLATY